MIEINYLEWVQFEDRVLEGDRPRRGGLEELPLRQETRASR